MYNKNLVHEVKYLLSGNHRYPLGLKKLSNLYEEKVESTGNNKIDTEGDKPLNH